MTIIFEDLFQIKGIDWKHVYHLPHRVTVDTILRIFQYKIWNNVLYLNEKLFRFKIFHARSVLSASLKVKHQYTFFWYKLKKILNAKKYLPGNTPQSAIFGFLSYEHYSEKHYHSWLNPEVFVQRCFGNV